MPTRLIREGWLESERINQLGADAERFFLRLCLRADDFGRYHANPVLLRSNLFPLREDVRSTDIPRWLAACEKAGLIRCYTADGKACLEIPKFDQRTRATASKFPAPPDGCLTSDGHAPDIRPADDGPSRTYSEAETYSEASRVPAPEKTFTDRESQRTLPESLNTPPFRAAWARWVDHWAERNKRTIPLATADSQLVLLAKQGASIAIEWIENAIARDLREPCAPLNPSKNGTHRTSNPRSFANQQDYSGVTDK